MAEVTPAHVFALHEPFLFNVLDRSVKAFHFFCLSGCFFQGSYITCKVPALEADDPDDPLLFLRDFYGSAASLRDPLHFPRSFLFSHFFSFLPFIKLAYCPECSDSEQDVYPERQGYIFSCKDAEDYCYVLFHNACPPVSALTGGFSFVVHTK